MAASEISKVRRLQLVGEAFRPAAPVDDLDLFTGRESQRSDVIGAVVQIGRHIGLYGERGVGKTSLARVLAQILDQENVPGFRAVMVNCNTDSTYESVWARILNQLGLGDYELEPEGIRSALESIDGRTLVVIDELDRLEDDEALSLMADTIKTLSDHAVGTTLMLVGVATSVEDLIGEHASIVRNLEQIKMPRMERDELMAILERGCEHAGLTVSEGAAERIVRLSEGLPHYTHLLGFWAAERAVQDERLHITAEDCEVALSRAVAGHTIESAYRRAIGSSQPGNLYREVLLACAVAEKDSLGYFRSGQIREPLAIVAGRYLDIPAFSKHLNEFLSVERGSVLRREGKPRNYSYRFSDPMMQPYVIMSALNDRVITHQALDRLQNPPDEPSATGDRREDDPNERGQLF